MMARQAALGKPVWTSSDPDWNVIHEDGSPFPGETRPVPRAIASNAAVKGAREAEQGSPELAGMSWYTIPMETIPDTQHRVSGPERELTISRLQEAYIRGQLSEHELGARIERALTAVVKADLTGLVGDLPLSAEAAPVAAVRHHWWRRRYDENVYKSRVRKTGVWTVPPVFRPRVYKGTLILDLRQAVLSAPDTVIEINAYKSWLTIIVPPEYSIKLEGTAYKGSMENLTAGGIPGAPRLLIHGSAYKSSVIVTASDPDAPRS